MELWLWTLDHLQRTTDANGAKLYSATARASPSRWPTPFAGSWRFGCRFSDALRLAEKGPDVPTLAEGLGGLCQPLHRPLQRPGGQRRRRVRPICAELVHGFAGPGGRGARGLRALRAAADAGMAGSRLAKDRAAEALAKVTIPEALDYPR